MGKHRKKVKPFVMRVTFWAEGRRHAEDLYADALQPFIHGVDDFVGELHRAGQEEEE